MAKKIPLPAKTDNTEEKILAAARKIFLTKGYAATRTRDIATEAGINLALLNYYFRSKEKLFQLVMQEKVQTMFKNIVPVVMDEETSLDEKIQKLVSNYITVLSKNPDLPIFILNEVRKKESGFIKSIPFGAEKGIKNVSFFRQVRELQTEVNPMHFLLNLLGMSIFPFLASPILLQTGMVDEKTFNQLIKERESLIPQWMSIVLRHQNKNQNKQQKPSKP
jgi:AcrR family transcriptional regulator